MGPRIWKTHDKNSATELMCLFTELLQLTFFYCLFLESNCALFITPLTEKNARILDSYCTAKVRANYSFKTLYVNAQAVATNWRKCNWMNVVIYWVKITGCCLYNVIVILESLAVCGYSVCDCYGKCLKRRIHFIHFQIKKHFKKIF